MLLIRRKQLAVMGQEVANAFDRQIIDYLHAEYPELTEPLGDLRLLGLVQKARSAAVEYRIRSAGALALWIELWLKYGERLKRAPERTWVENILRHPTLPDYVRLDQVNARLFRSTGGRPVVISRVEAEN